jgi:hypothetical protein
MEISTYRRPYIAPLLRLHLVLRGRKYYSLLFTSCHEVRIGQFIDEMG